MKLVVTYLCELCQTPLTTEKIHSRAKDDVTIPYRYEYMFCDKCRREYEMLSSTGVASLTFGNG